MKEGIGIWKKVPRSTRFLFFSELIARSAMAMTQMLFLVYAFYVLKIGGGVDPSALQQARIMWGYVMTVLFMSMIALSFPVGKLLDKAGRRIPLIISNLLVIPSTLILIYGNYLTLYIALPLMGFSALLTFSSYQALFADLVPQAQRGKVTGSNHFFTYLGTAVTGAIGGFTYEAVSPQTPFLLTIILIIPSTAILLFRVKEPKPEERQA
jgi:MFS family permease